MSSAAGGRSRLGRKGAPLTYASDFTFTDTLYDVGTEGASARASEALGHPCALGPTSSEVGMLVPGAICAVLERTLQGDDGVQEAIKG